MSKKELIKKYGEIVLKTNGEVGDYVVAISQFGSEIRELQTKVAELENKLPKYDYEKCKDDLQNHIMILINENKQLKHQLQALPKQILEEIREYNFTRFFTDETEIIELRELDELLKNLEERWLRD